MIGIVVITIGSYSMWQLFPDAFPYKLPWEGRDALPFHFFPLIVFIPAISLLLEDPPIDNETLKKWNLLGKNLWLVFLSLLLMFAGISKIFIRKGYSPNFYSSDWSLYHHVYGAGIFLAGAVLIAYLFSRE